MPFNNRNHLAGALAAGWLALQTAAAEDPPAVDVSRLPPAAQGAVDFVKDVQPIFQTACYDCHSADLQEAGLRLDSRKRAMAGGDSGAVIKPGEGAASRLLHLVSGLDEETGPMPPEGIGEPLTTAQVSLLRAWIDQGADWPDAAAGDDALPAGADHWSFQPITRPSVPETADDSWARNPIDAFVLARLESQKVSPSPEADRTTLLRRIYLDLVGLPPSPHEVADFLDDQRAGAYERVVDRLLESPHYGERWGRHWLDAARYADSDGYEKDGGRPHAWRYRDWVIDAVNRDLPFDAFTVQQLAGDLLAPSDGEYDPAARVATGFHRNTLINTEGGADKEEDRVKRTVDRTNTLGSVWLGLSVGCANCHSHKYDPISQHEYFGLYAFFNNLQEVDHSAAPGEMTVIKREPMPREVLPKDIRARGAEDRNNAPPEQPPKEPAELFQAVAQEPAPRETFVHLRGDFLSPGAAAEPHTPEVLPPLESRGAKPDRLDLARWVVSPQHPLTARVLANRLWQLHFGRGLVATGDDFGTQGEPPSHPELLDWLASEIHRGGWRLKPLHRLIVTSAAYRQSAAARPELRDRDPYNAWLARQNRLRVEAEIVRDLALAASGLLQPAIGGPSVRPPQPPGVSELTYNSSASWVESAGANRYRRGMYIWFQRTSPYPSLISFDAPESILACTRRERSNTPLQALTLLNDVVFVEAAQALGGRMLAGPGDELVAAPQAIDARLRYGFRLALSREPTASELAALAALYHDAEKLYAADPQAAQQLLGKADPGAGPAKAQSAACVAVARALLNLDEFITRE